MKTAVTALFAVTPLASAWRLAGTSGPVADNLCAYPVLDWQIGGGSYDEPETACLPLYASVPSWFGDDGYDRFKWNSNEDCSDYDNMSGCGNYVSVMRMYKDEGCSEQVGDDRISFWCDVPDPAAQYYKLHSLI